MSEFVKGDIIVRIGDVSRKWVVEGIHPMEYKIVELCINDEVESSLMWINKKECEEKFLWVGKWNSDKNVEEDDEA